MLRKKGKYQIGDNHDDIQASIVAFSKKNKIPATLFKNILCDCGSETFLVALDEDQGAAIRRCVKCEEERPIGDSEDYLEEAEIDVCECVCGESGFQLSVGLALYAESDDVKWLYIGCRCGECGITGVYGDWKNEYPDAREFLGKI